MIKIRKPSNGTGHGTRLLVCLTLALLLLAQAVGAAEETAEKSYVDPVEHSDNYSAVLYDNTNGLPTSEANEIVQTSEGFLWIGSYSGLIRYDGNTFERMDSTTGIASVVALHVDKRDRLWIGTNDSGLAMMERGKIRYWHEEDGIGSDKINWIEEDGSGTIYVGTTAGITTFTPGLKLRHVDDPRIAGAYIEQMKWGEDGLLYCITNEDDFFTLRDNELVDYIDHTKTRIQGITCILPDPNKPGDIYIGTENSSFYHGNLKRDIREMERFDISPLFTMLDIKQIRDRIWICANNGIGVLDDKGFHQLSHLPMDNRITQVMEDYEGNLWFTSDRQGVMKLVLNKFSDIFQHYGLPEQVVNSTCMHEGRLFIATDTGLIVLGKKKPLTTLPLKSAKTASGVDLKEDDLLKLLDGCRIRSVIHDSKGRLWISTWRSNGLLRYDKGELVAFTEAEGLLSDHIRSVCEASDGSILVADTGGLNVIRGNRVTASYSRDNGIVNPETLIACAAPNGDILVGSNGDGIYVINKKGTRCIGKKNGLTSGIIMRIKHDPKRNLYWIVTSNSLAYMTEDYKVTTVRNFPYSNNFDLFENKKGDMWVLSSDGIYVLPVQELIANDEIKPIHYDISNGLPCITTTNSYSDLTPEGDLYISGYTGVAKVNIDSPLENISDLKQSVPYVDVDGKRLFPDGSGSFTIPAGTQKLTVYGYVYNYSMTDPKVTYRLEGFDRKTVTVRRSELGPVTYTNLPGGSYRFVMELKDAMGRGSRMISVPITKKKALHEELWFYCLIGLASLLFLIGLIRTYVRRKMHRLETQHQEEAERARIGNELTMANQIQASMLPHEFPPFPDRKEFDIYASMDPAREVGGDFYDFFLIDEDHLCMVIADVSGKGIPAALFMMVSKVILQSCAMLGRSAGEILTKTNEGICSDNQVEMFVTVWLGILEISTGRITAANAGHEYPALMKHRDGEFKLFKDRHGLVIGAIEGIKYREYEFQLAKGDKLFVYTDGVPEATAHGNEMFGTERMLAALNSEPERPPDRILETVRTSVNEFVRDAEQFDDMTMLCIEYKGIPDEASGT